MGHPADSSDRAVRDAGAWSSRLGARLQQAREAAGLSQESVQCRLGYPTRSLTRWENGGADPGFAKVARMATLYGVSMDWIADRGQPVPGLQPGMVVIDLDAVATLERAVERGDTIEDLPPRLLRAPGVDYAQVVPSNAIAVSEFEARDYEQKVKELWSQLSGRA